MGGSGLRQGGSNPCMLKDWAKSARVSLLSAPDSGLTSLSTKVREQPAVVNALKLGPGSAFLPKQQRPLAASKRQRPLFAHDIPGTQCHSNLLRFLSTELTYVSTAF